MSDEYQLRKDIDRFNRLFYNFEQELGIKLNNNINSLVEVFNNYYDQSFIDIKINELLGLINSKANIDHSHDDRYYTESEIDVKLNSKANIDHSHDDRYYTESEIDERINSLQTYSTQNMGNVTMDYNSAFVFLNINQLSNSGENSTVYNLNIPSNFAPKNHMNVPSFAMYNGNPYAFARIRTNGLIEIITNRKTYNSSGGVVLNFSIFYPRI